MNRLIKKPEYVEQLKNATIKNEDYSEIMLECDDPDTFMFLDPPYDETMKYKTPFTEKHHRTLAFLFACMDCKCLMIINKGLADFTTYGAKRYCVFEAITSYVFDQY